ncbi:hypothetical protein IK146_02965 [Candidatus Saccharibacteria bacterium]|nr:hypothetical protein [Candidatus Saccharibacteria bacterium]
MLFTDCLLPGKETNWATYYDRNLHVFEVSVRLRKRAEGKLLIRVSTAVWDDEHPRNCPERNDLMVDENGGFYVAKETEHYRHGCVLAHVSASIPTTAVDYVAIWPTLDSEWVVIDFSGVPGEKMMVEELKDAFFIALLDCGRDANVHSEGWSSLWYIKGGNGPHSVYSYAEQYPDCPGLIRIPSPIPEGWNPWTQIKSLVH